MPTPPELLRVRRAARALDHALTRRDEAVMAAVEAGSSLRAVADAAQLTHPGVRALVRRVHRDTGDMNRGTERTADPAG